MHSGSWGRWGLFGHILRWSLLVAVVAVASLQVTYRVYTPLRQIEILHQIEGVVEVVLSAVLILKLLLNVYLANLDSAGTISRLNVLLCYSPMIIALAMSVAIGAVDVIQCEWQSPQVQLLLRLRRSPILGIHSGTIVTRSRAVHRHSIHASGNLWPTQYRGHETTTAFAAQPIIVIPQPVTFRSPLVRFPDGPASHLPRAYPSYAALHARGRCEASGGQQSRPSSIIRKQIVHLGLLAQGLLSQRPPPLSWSRSPLGSGPRRAWFLPGRPRPQAFAHVARNLPRAEAKPRVPRPRLHEHSPGVCDRGRDR